MAMLRPRAGGLLLSAVIVAGAGLVDAACKCDNLLHFGDPIAQKLSTEAFKIGATRSANSATECADLCLALSDDAEPCAAFQIAPAANECQCKRLF